MAKRTVGRVLIACCLLLCSFGTLGDTLRVGINPEYPPLIYKDDGEITGIDAAMAREAAKILDRKLQFVEMSFEQLIPSLVAGDVDVIMSGLSVTPERAEQVAFTNSYLTIGQMAIIRTADMVPFALPRALNKPGARVGVEPGTTGASYAAEYLPDAKVSEFTSPDQAFKALLDKRIDFYIHDAPTSWNLAQQADSPLMSLFKPLTREQLAWAVRKDDIKLLTSLNYALEQLENNGRLTAIQTYFVPVRVSVGD